MTLSCLLTEVRACRICAAHLPHGPRPVLQADGAARILIAGQAPGRRVHDTGVPFDDPSGQRLRQWMGIGADVFHDPTKIIILPMGFCYPGTGKSGDLPPRAECAPQWRQRLLTHLPDVELTLVIGRHAQAYHLPDSPHASLTATVRAWHEVWPQFLPLPHPSPRNNIWLRKNPWFADEILPRLRRRVSVVLANRA